MINHKIERLIFILVFVILVVVFSAIMQQIKVYHAPINFELSPDEVINKELEIVGNNPYRYEIINNSIIVLVDHSMGVSQLYVGARNLNSGFMFNVPKSIFALKPNLFRFLKIQDGYLGIKVSNQINDYVVEISLREKDLTFAEDPCDIVIKDQNGDILKKFKYDGVSGVFWVDVLENIPEDYKAIVEQNNKEIFVIDAKEIFDLFGGQKK